MKVIRFALVYLTNILIAIYIGLLFTAEMIVIAIIFPRYSTKYFEKLVMAVSKIESPIAKKGD